MLFWSFGELVLMGALLAYAIHQDRKMHWRLGICVQIGGKVKQRKVKGVLPPPIKGEPPPPGME